MKYLAVVNNLQVAVFGGRSPHEVIDGCKRYRKRIPHLSVARTHARRRRKPLM